MIDLSPSDREWMREWFALLAQLDQSIKRRDQAAGLAAAEALKAHHGTGTPAAHAALAEAGRRQIN